MISDENGSAEQQAERIDERATEATAPGQSYRGEGFGRRGSESSEGAMRRFGERVRSRPAGSLMAGLALIAASAAAIAIRNQRPRLGLWWLRRQARVLAEAFRERDLTVRPKAFGMIARLAALGLAGLTWRRVRAIGHNRYL